MPKPSVVVNDDRHEVFIEGKEAHLPKRIYEALKFLINSGGKVISREEFLSSIHHGKKKDLRTVDMYVSRLRKAGIKNIKTVTAYGYCWRDQ